MTFLRDLRYGARSLLKTPALMIVATLALGVGIGLTATMWSIIYGAMIKGLPYEDAQRIVIAMRSNPTRGDDRMGVTVHDYADWSAQATSFESLGASTCGTMNVSGVEKAERFDGCWMTAEALEIPRVRPVLGRLFRSGEDRAGGDRVVIIGHSLWRNRYAGASDVLGKGIRVNGVPHTVVGVMPDGFLFPNNTQIWIPYQVDALATKRGQGQELQVIGKLREGVSMDAANVELAAIAKRIAADHKESNEGITAFVEPFVKGYIGPEPRRLLFTMLGAVGFVLLIACANVANLLASLFAGLLPAIQSARADINEILKDESRGASSLHIGRMSRALVVFEIALSCALLVAAGLMTKSVTKMRNIDPGFDVENLFTARVGFPATYTDSVKVRQFFELLPERLAQIPGAQGIAVSSGLPGVNMWKERITLEGKTYARAQDRPEASTLRVSAGFFETYRIPVRVGRVFTAADRRDALPVAVVTQKFVDTHFAGQDPIGRRFRFVGSDSLIYRTIVGVVPNIYADSRDHFTSAAFLPLAQSPVTFASMTIRTGGEPMAITQSVRDVVASLDADIPIYWTYTMREALARPTWFVRVFGTMFMIFGAIALFLAGIGLYAVMAFSVSRRTREVGIRMALGARGTDVVRLIFGQGMIQLAIGLAIGLGMAAGVSQLLGVILFDVQPRDPVIFGGVVAVLATAGLLACLIPARRATSVDPMIALRD